ncbi:UDP-galactopyranose mutase [Niabella hibiscisoli]|uniref:UDP-galactopyranose mutase n=1 Tax=Niabella hibiscisoli TaxID=1825928 RepID=UPI001F0FF052|nr:UDP-galactopyranose mutase [Niabella hibiscisoli]MCH5716254.1 UDP-galactopyranose mutase [Niabella hibiscisoli]
MFSAQKYDYLIVGAGLFGSVFAHQMNQIGKKCLVIDKRSHFGGNVYCENYEGINVHCYGAHIFHTNDETIWNFVNSFVKFNKFVNSPLAYFNGKMYNLPFNMNTFSQLWGVTTPKQAEEKIRHQTLPYLGKIPQNLEEQALALVGDDIYYSFIKGYSEKQWGKRTTELPAFIIKRIPLRFTYDNNYFNDKYQGIPIGGYNGLTKELLKSVEVRLNTDYFVDRASFDTLANKIVFTGTIDSFFEYKLGKLEYRSLRFEHETKQIENFQGNAVINYTQRAIPYTRIIEHKHFEFGKQPHTVITKEFPQPFSNHAEPYYPINDIYNNKRYNQYKELASTKKNIHFGGRLGNYQYFDMHQVIAAALKLAKSEATQL